MKQMKKALFLLLVLFISLPSCKDDTDTPEPDILQLLSVHAGTIKLDQDDLTSGIPLDAVLVARFSTVLSISNMDQKFILLDSDDKEIDLSFSFLDEKKTISAKPTEELLPDQSYTIHLDESITGENGEVFSDTDFQFSTLIGALALESIQINGEDASGPSYVKEVPTDFSIDLTFSHEVNTADLLDEIIVLHDGNHLELEASGNEGQALSFHLAPTTSADHFARYYLHIPSSLQSVDGNQFNGFTKYFYTQVDSTPKFPIISDEELLDLVQRQTFKYFWDFGHPTSGMTRERNTSGNTVTSGGSGFGIMAILIGMERGYISREDGILRLQNIMFFLSNADRFHGAWSHWINGNTGTVIPFSPDDNGGDLVETAFLTMGLLTARQYLDTNITVEWSLYHDIDELWKGVEWDWYTQNSQDVLYWHWSPNFGWVKNHKIGGYNEALATYVMAAASPDHGIDASVYHNGWARNGSIINGNSFYGIELPLGSNYGGPLFFEHYSYIGINPMNLTDLYGDYREQCINHTLINRQHCIENPYNYVGYSKDSWGLTASDNHEGYSAHSPTNDKGVITPTGAISSIPYTPQESLEAIRFFYYIIGDKLWGEYGFYDAFNPTEGWVASSYLAIDQGPIICMIENYRTGLLWDLFMSAPEVQASLQKLGFSH
jgi:hypothetical protein